VGGPDEALHVLALVLKGGMGGGGGCGEDKIFMNKMNGAKRMYATQTTHLNIRMRFLLFSPFGLRRKQA